MKKRGMSQVIATLLIIAMVLVAIALVWIIIRGILQRGTEEITLSKLTVDLRIEGLRIDEENGLLYPKIKRNPGEGELKGITFLVFDGANTHSFEKLDVELEILEIRTFFLEYEGPITRLSIAPMFETESGRIITGSITDIYYVGLGGSEWGDCTPDCGTSVCGLVPNGCGFSCGTCPPEAQYCDDGVCRDIPCDNTCTCAETTCINDTCLNDCNNVCQGEVPPNCGAQECGTAPNGCGTCGTCQSGTHCSPGEGGICAPDCTPNCAGKECGDNGCGGQCGFCEIGTEWCAGNGTCMPIETCEPNCTGRDCGLDPNCGESCGQCNESLGEQCISGKCLMEKSVNNGTVLSVWPMGVGIYFDSPDLPKSGVDYTLYYARFPGSLEIDCIRIAKYSIPLDPEIYNISRIELSTTSTEIQANDKYEIWENFTGCVNAP